MAEGRKLDESLVQRVALLSSGGQRWLKTALQAIQTIEPTAAPEPAPEVETHKEPADRERALLKPADLEDVITGKANLREQLEAYPELSDELEGLGDVIDLLREAGERRRRRGAEILRELLEGEAPEEGGESGEERPPNRPRR